MYSCWFFSFSSYCFAFLSIPFCSAPLRFVPFGSVVYIPVWCDFPLRLSHPTVCVCCVFELAVAAATAVVVAAVVVVMVMMVRVFYSCMSFIVARFHSLQHINRHPLECMHNNNKRSRFQFANMHLAACFLMVLVSLYRVSLLLVGYCETFGTSRVFVHCGQTLFWTWSAQPQFSDTDTDTDTTERYRSTQAIHTVCERSTKYCLANHQ